MVFDFGAASVMDAPAARGLPRGGRNFRMTGVRHSHPDRDDGPARLTPILPQLAWSDCAKLLTSDKTTGSTPTRASAPWNNNKTGALGCRPQHRSQIGNP